MKKFIINMLFGVFQEWLPHFLGGYDNLLNTLIIFIISEFLTEIMCSIIRKKREKELSIKGIFKKITIFLMIGIATTLDTCIINDYSILRTVSICYYISIEGKMLLKNIKRIDGDIPPKIKEILKQIRKKSENTEKIKNSKEKDNTHSK